MGVECQYCGKEFGNAGAKGSHERSCDQRPEPAQQTPAETARQGQQPQQQPQQAEPAPQAQPPATAQQQAQGQAQGGQNLPAQQQGGGGNPIETGMQLGEALAGARSDDPGAQAKAKGEMTKMAGAALAKIGETVAERGQQRHQRAKQNANRSTKKSQDYPECVECGGQIAEVPAEEPFGCPHCGTLLEFE